MTNEIEYNPWRRIATYEDLVRRAEDCSYLSDRDVDWVKETYKPKKEE